MPVRLAHVTTVDLSLRFLLRNQLLAFSRAGYHVVSISAPGPWVTDLVTDGIMHVGVPSLQRRWAPAADLVSMIRLTRIFRYLRPDIVHTHTPKAGVLGRIAARLAKVPFVVNTAHGLYGNDGPAARRHLFLLLERVAARCSDFEFCQSSEDLKTLRRLGIVAPERSAHLGNGVDLSAFDPDRLNRSAARDALGIAPDSLVVGTVGRLVWEKGYREFFALAEQLRSTHDRVEALAVGPLEAAKRDGVPAHIIDDLSRRGTVRFLGMRTDMPAIYRAMDIFVLPSYREGFPRSAIEAAAMGLPLVLTDIRGCREIVSDGINGFLVPPKSVDALSERVDRLIADADLRTRFGMESRRRALSEFDEARVIKDTLVVYRRLLETRHGLRDGYNSESTAAG